MRRIHLFEFCDLDRFPHTWRTLLTDFMGFFATTVNPFGPLVPKLAEVLRRLGSRRIIDLCSGSCGALVQIREQLERRENCPVTVVLTDKYPNLDAFRRAGAGSNGKVTYMESPVDATDVPPEAEGFRTMFVAFHHFPPEAARKILQDAVTKKAGIGIFEYTERSLIWVLPVLLIPLYMWLATPFTRPFTWQRLVWIYLIPIVPLVGMWDGMVSNLRTYSPAELKDLTAEISYSHYSWEIGKMRTFGAGRVTYLFGLPSEDRASPVK
jgi:hypothetical protein